MSYSYKDAVRPNYNEYMLNYLNQSGYYNGYGFFTCRNPEHNDHKPSMSFNPKNNTIHCFSCGCTYGLVDLVMVDHHLSYSDAVNWIRVNLMGEQPIKSNVAHQTCDFRVFYSELVEDYTYLNKRGINGYLASRMGVRYYPPHNSVIFTNGIECYTERFITGDIRYKHYGSIELYNRTQPVNADKWTIVVEGEMDCLSIYEAINFKEGVYSSVSKLPVNCLALGSCNNWHKLIKSGIDRLVLALDNDDAGRKATEAMSIELIRHNIDFYIVNLYDKYKDANEILLADKKLLQLNIKKMLKECKNRV